MSSHGEIFPPEIIEATLYRLPVKSLGRFKCVSKLWRSLISKPQFIKSHLHQNHHQTKLLLLSNSKSLYSVDISDDPAVKQLFFRQPIRWEEISGSCDGLVLAKDEDDSMFLLNPTTREISDLPDSPFALPLRESHIMYGFGYDSSTDDYKVVSISFWDTDNEYNPDCTDMFVNVYSLRRNSWISAENSPYDHAVGNCVSGIYLNGCLHWLASRVDGYKSAIAAFGLADEKFTELPLPDSVDEDKAVFNELVVLGGKLAIFGYLLGSVVWVMEEYGVGESWTKISIEGIEIDPMKPICSVGGFNLDVVLGGEDEVVVYGVEERRTRAMNIHGVADGFVVGAAYVESLVSPACI